MCVQANRTQLFGVYSEVKGYICCSVPDVLSPMWIGLTFAGACVVPWVSLRAAVTCTCVVRTD
jgi:hypothetical protein